MRMRVKEVLLSASILSSVTDALYIPQTSKTSLTTTEIPFPRVMRDGFANGQESKRQGKEAGQKRRRGVESSEALPVVKDSPTVETEDSNPENPTVSSQSVLMPPAKPQDYRFTKEATKKLAQLGASGVDLIVPGIILSTTSGIIWYLQKYDDDNGLVIGAAASGGVLMLIQADVAASQPLLIATVVTYLSFHIAYCKVVAKQLKHADGFIAATVLTATALLGVIAHIPSIADMWKESSGVLLLWTIFPLHIFSVFFSALAVRVTRKYFEYHNRTTGVEKDYI